MQLQCKEVIGHLVFTCFFVFFLIIQLTTLKIGRLLQNFATPSIRCSPVPRQFLLLTWLGWQDEHRYWPGVEVTEQNIIDILQSHCCFVNPTIGH